METPSQALDRLTRTFTADQQFFDALLAAPCGEAYLEMSVWYIWLQDYLHDIQNSLEAGGKKHGPEYQVWVVSMIGGAAACIGMLMYLVARGVINEAAASGRRALEYLGMAAHLVRDPSKTRFLDGADVRSPGFVKAFITGESAEAKRLKRDGIRYRLSGMTMANPATRLYEIFSQFNVHGGTMGSLVSVAVTPTRHSCAFHNRSLEQVAKNLPLFKPILEITAVELVNLAGNYGESSQRLRQAGACVLVWLDHNDPKWLERLSTMREHFCPESVRPN